VAIALMEQLEAVEPEPENEYADEGLA